MLRTSRLTLSEIECLTCHPRADVNGHELLSGIEAVMDFVAAETQYRLISHFPGHYKPDEVTVAFQKGVGRVIGDLDAR